MSVSTVITLGYGSFAGVQFLPTLGYLSGGTPPPPPPAATPSGGGDSSRLVRRRREWLKAWHKWKHPDVLPLPEDPEERYATVEVAKTLEQVEIYLHQEAVDFLGALEVLRETEQRVALSLAESRIRKLFKEARRNLERLAREELERLAREEEEEVGELLELL